MASEALSKRYLFLYLLLKQEAKPVLLRQATSSSVHHSPHFCYSCDFSSSKAYFPLGAVISGGCWAPAITARSNPTSAWGFSLTHWSEQVGSCGEARNQSEHSWWLMTWLDLGDYISLSLWLTISQSWFPRHHFDPCWNHTALHSIVYHLALGWSLK